ncbi:MAG: SusC/RagA family TonB-linked outer membrane protein [Candidatus Kapaibacterium sp.]
MKTLLLFVTIIIASVGSAAQSVTIRGTVTDEGGSAIVGASVRVANSRTGAYSRSKGAFEIKVPAAIDVTLTVNMVGYKTTEVSIAKENLGEQVAITLKTDHLKLKETVVVGYGTKQRVEMTGSVAQIDSREIAQNTYGNFENAIVGRAPGVQVINSNGMAGSAMTIRVRGVGSLTASGEPLYVIDGVPVTQGDFGGKDRLATQTNALASINPNDIESIDILKDADAAAIYGSRGSNGVVLITTKKGASGATRFNVSLFRGQSTETNRVSLLSGDEYRGMWAEANRQDSVALSILRPTARFTAKPLPGGLKPDQFANTDWLGLTMRQGEITDAAVTASGGTSAVTFFTSLGYRNESSYAVGNSFERINGRANVDFKATESVSIGLSSNLNYSLNTRVPSAWAGGIGAAQSSALPYFPIYNSDGTYFEPQRPWYAMYNPVAQLNENQFQNSETRLLTNLYTQIALPEHFSLRLQGGFDLLNFTDRRYTSLVVQSEAEAEARKVGVNNFILNGTLSYDNSIADGLKLNAMVAMETQSSNQLVTGLKGRNFPNPAFRNPTSAVVREAYSYETAFSFMSYITRWNFNYVDKYFVSLTGRVDGSSRFGSENRYGFFPSLGAGWILSKEDFLKGVESISLLKLRASIGLTGNADGIDDYQWQGTYKAGADYGGTPGIRPDRLANPQLGWEQTRQIDITAEAGFWNGRLQATVSWYHKLTSNVLLNVAVPASTGFSSILKNVGSFENTGVEVVLSGYPVTSGEFTWRTDLSIAHNTNKVLDNAGLPPDAIGGPGETRILVGYPVGTFFINRSAGVQSRTDSVTVQRRRSGNAVTFLTSKDDARWNQFYDTTIVIVGGSQLFYNLNGRITDQYDLNDRVALGNPYPTWFGAFTNTINWKGFDLTAMIYYQFGNQIYDDAAKRQVGNLGSNFNQVKDQTERRWQKEGDVTDVPRLSLTENYDINTDRFIYDGSFVRLRQLTLGYTIPGDYLEMSGLSSLRVYLTGQNLLTWTNYPGWDPEIMRDQDGAQGRNLGAGVTYLTPPQAKQLVIGINAGF